MGGTERQCACGFVLPLAPRAILDQRWAEFGRQLEYRRIWGGGQFILVPP